MQEGTRRAGRAGTSEISLDLNSTWVPITVTARVAAGTEQVALLLAGGAGKGAVQFDDMSLDRSDTQGSWQK